MTEKTLTTSALYTPILSEHDREYLERVIPRLHYLVARGWRRGYHSTLLAQDIVAFYNSSRGDDPTLYLITRFGRPRLVLEWSGDLETGFTEGGVRVPLTSHTRIRYTKLSDFIEDVVI